MTAGWVAASTRGRALLRRTLDTRDIAALATADSWDEARGLLASTGFGNDLASTADRSSARLAATRAMVWQLRVLAGWLPPASTGLARVFAAPVEIGEIERHLERLDRAASEEGGNGDRRPETISLGSLGTSWPRLARTTSIDDVRRVLARSAWGDTGGDDRTTVLLGLRTAWYRRLVRQVPATAEWAHGATAVLVARERFVFERPIPDIAARTIDQLLGRAWREATSLSDLIHHLPRSAAWPFADGAQSSEPSALWSVELAVVRRATADATRVADSGRAGRHTVAAVMALLLLNLRQVHSAIEAAGRVPVPAEVFDDVA